MIHELKPYPACRDSGVPWLGELPEHWDVLPLKRVAWFKGGVEFPVAEQGKEGLEVPFLKVSDMTRHGNGKWISAWKHTVSRETAQRLGAYVLPAGSLILPKVGGAMLTNKRRLLRQPSCIDNNILGCVVRHGDGEFLFVVFQQLDLGQLCKPGPVPAISGGEVREIDVPFPPLKEQSAIGRFLDHVDRRIRRYIRSKQKLIALLHEQRQAIIHRAVTRGLDPNVRLKPSGVEWLGDVPEHWEVAALRFRYSQCLGKMLDTKRILGLHSLSYLRNVNVQWDRITTADLPVMDIAPSEYQRYTVRSGDLLVCEGGEVGRSAIWNGELARCGFQKALHRLRPLSSERDLPRFLLYALQVASKAGAFDDGHQSTIAHLTGDKLRAHRFVFPPKAEQVKIVAHLDREFGEIDRTVMTVGREISLLREYRTRLIADVVTGKLDVREAATHLPEETGEPEPLDDTDTSPEDISEETEPTDPDAALEEAEA